VFEVGRDHKVRILSETPGDAERTAVEQAVTYCPTHALKIVDD
jgi:ferredoxin